MTAASGRIALLAGTGLLLANVLSLASWAYQRFAERGLAAIVSEPTITAARIASQVTPWSGTSVALYGWLLSDAGRFAESNDAYLRALKWNPADPLLWSEYALIVGRRGDFGALDVPVAQAYRLAPASPAVQSTLAEMGASYWTFATEDTRDIWLRSLRYTLRNNRNSFLHSVAVRGKAISFCEGPGTSLPVRRWCGFVLASKSVDE